MNKRLLDSWNLDLYTEWARGKDAQKTLKNCKNEFLDDLEKIKTGSELPLEIKSAAGNTKEISKKNGSDKTRNKGSKVTQNITHNVINNNQGFINYGNNASSSSHNNIDSDSNNNNTTNGVQPPPQNFYFQNTFQQGLNINIDTSNKRGREENSEENARSARRINFREFDNVVLPNMDISLGSHIGSIPRSLNAVPNTRQSRYFHACGMNGVVDLSDLSDHSQAATLNASALNHFKSIISSQCQVPIITLPEQVEQFDAILNTYYEEDISVRQYLINSLQAIKNIYTGDELAIVEDIYTHILKVHLYHDYFFKPDYKPKSEADFLIKVWSPVFETAFRSFDSFSDRIITHWGDTISDQVMDNGMHLRMDLRVLARSINNTSDLSDTATGEFAPRPFASKMYKDKLKTVLASKCQLNEILDNYPGLTEQDALKITIPFVVIMGLEFEIYTFKLAANGLYVVDVVYSTKFPENDEELKDGGVKNVIHGLLLLKKMCKDVHKYLDKKEKKQRSNKPSRMQSLRGAAEETTPNQLQWHRDVWSPPPYSGSD